MDSGSTSDTEADAAEWHAVLKGHKTKPAAKPITIPSALITEAPPIDPLLIILLTPLPATDPASANSGPDLALMSLDQNVPAQSLSPLSELLDEPTPTVTNDKNCKKITKVLKAPMIARARHLTHKN